MRKRSHSFTLIELMMVIVVIAILAGIILSALYKTHEKARKRQRALARMTLASSIVNYKANYSKWPMPALGPGTYSNNNIHVVQMLIAPPDPVLLLKKGNYKQTENGSLMDPFGRCYVIRLDGTNVYVDGTSVTEY